MRKSDFGHLQRADSLEKTLMLGRIEGRRRKGWQRMRWLDGITNSMDMDGFGWTLVVGDGQWGLACCGSWGRRELDMTEWLNWTELNWGKVCVQSGHSTNFHFFSLYSYCTFPIQANNLKKKISSEIQYVNIIFWILLPWNNETGDP